MKVEVLVATMHQKDHSLVEKMNIQTDAVIVNQCDREDCEEFEHNGNKIKFISKKERGLSRSRNLAVKNATGDICIIVDDDVVYEDKYEEMVIKAYEEIPEADIIVFDVPFTNQLNYRMFGNKAFKMNFRTALKVSSCKITFKRKPIIDNNIRFLPIFGAGSVYNHGEENIFIKECKKRGSKIYYYPKRIAINKHGESTWFKGFNRKYFFDIGAIYYELFGNLYLPFALKLLLKNKKKLKDITVGQGVKAVVEGKKEYKNKKEEENA